MKLGVLMDPIGSIDFKKDSTLAILLEAQARNHEIYYMEPSSLFLKGTTLILIFEVLVGLHKYNILHQGFF